MKKIIKLTFAFVFIISISNIAVFAGEYANATQEQGYVYLAETAETGEYIAVPSHIGVDPFPCCGCGCTFGTCCGGGSCWWCWEIACCCPGWCPPSPHFCPC
ncbi:MAG: hypothetical protein FWG63_07530 [Defluviitaleaceae bacterium]|nr:hypothetical protein [Defluviitaleaceae bacterium]